VQERGQITNRECKRLCGLTPRQAGCLLSRWRHPRWKLEEGRYIVKVRIKTGGREFNDTFLIVNDVPYEDFRIEPLRDNLKAKVL